MSSSIEHWHHDHCSGLEPILKGGELIRRQMAIDALKQQAETMSEWSNRYAEQRKGVLTAVNIIVDLPSAQPDAYWKEQCQSYERTINKLRESLSTQPEIIRCKDCKHWDTTWQNDYAPNYHYCPMIDGTHRNDFYCAYAERRQDG